MNKKSTADQDTILNPYYNQAAQGLLNTSGWYNPYSTAIAPNLNAALGSYISPIVSSLLLNCRHDKLAITPSFSFQNGGYYGSPLDTNGLDPRACQLNSARTTGAITKVSPKTNPLQCNVLFGTGTGLGSSDTSTSPIRKRDRSCLITTSSRARSSGIFRSHTT